MNTLRSRFGHRFSLLVLLGLSLVLGNPQTGLNAQARGADASSSLDRSGQAVVDLPVDVGSVSPAPPRGPRPPTPLPTPLEASGSGAGLTIIPTFNANIDAATQIVINNVIAFYHTTFTNNLTVNIEFHNMASGLAQTSFFTYSEPYSTYRAALAAAATTADDTVAVANTPVGAVNPINGDANIRVKPPNGRVLGFNTPGLSFNINGSPCPTFTGDACIGINTANTDIQGGAFSLFGAVQHEIDEALGLGSALGSTNPSVPWPEDLFRWASSGVRSFAANTSASNPCVTTPAAFFSINGGVTNLNQFNNCNNGGDYGDWITHTPAQVQDAFGTPFALALLTLTSTEVRALDVIGYSPITPPAISISDATVTEGNSGTTNATFAVTLSSASPSTVTVNYDTADGTATNGSAINAATITIPETSAPGLAVPYPSTITVPSGLGLLTKVRVKLFQFSHGYPQDVDVLLVGPGGQKMVLMSDAGGFNDVASVNLAFDDAASLSLTSGTLVSGTYKPTNINDMDGLDNYPSPAPVAPYSTTLAAFNGTDPAGQWKLYVVDDFPGEDGGSFLGGWSLELTAPVQDFTQTSGTLTFPPGTTTQNIVVPVVGDATVEPTETFFVNLSGAVNSTLADSQAVGTILNDDGPSPAITGINPNFGSQNSTFTVTITGTDLTGVSSAAFGTGVTASILGGGTATSLQASLIIAPDAPTGARTVTVTAGALTSAPSASFTVNPSGGATKRRSQVTTN